MSNGSEERSPATSARRWPAAAQSWSSSATESCRLWCSPAWRWPWRFRSASARGIFSASFPGSRFEKAISLVGLVAVALPEYFVGALVVIVFALELRLLPAISYSPDFSTLSGFVRALTLPVLTMTAAIFAHMSRLTRAAMTDVLRSSYIEMAILKGVSRRRLVFLHTLPNALGPIANVVALSVGYMFGGVILVEVVFAYPGLARLMVDAVSARDIPLVQATTLLFAGSYIVINVVADLVAVLANPRLRS